MNESSTEEVIDKIKRIMRLAQRTSEAGEASAARQKAELLAKKHGISIESLDCHDSDIKTIYDCDTELFTKPGIELGLISAVIHEHFGVVIIQHRFPGKREVKVSWVGTPLNIGIAIHVFNILSREVKHAYDKERFAPKRYVSIDGKPTLLPAAARKVDKTSFLNGWFSAIHKTLSEHPLRNDIDQFEAEKKSAEALFKQMKKDMDIGKGRNLIKNKLINRKDAAAGFIAGKKVHLNRPCEAGDYTPKTQLGD